MNSLLNRVYVCLHAHVKISNCLFAGLLNVLYSHKALQKCMCVDVHVCVCVCYGVSPALSVVGLHIVNSRVNLPSLSVSTFN